MTTSILFHVNSRETLLVFQASCFNPGFWWVKIRSIHETWKHGVCHERVAWLRWRAGRGSPRAKSKISVFVDRSSYGFLRRISLEESERSLSTHSSAMIPLYVFLRRFKCCYWTMSCGLMFCRVSRNGLDLPGECAACARDWWPLLGQKLITALLVSMLIRSDAV